MRNVTLALLAATTAIVAAPAQAVMIADGTVTIANLFVPNVSVTGAGGSFSSINGTTFQTIGTGGFAPVTGNTGTFNGTINFSSTTGDAGTQPLSLSNLFVFNDGQGGTYNFSASSVTTRTFANTPGLSTSVSLYLLGTTVNAAQNLEATPTSLTLSFNSTGGSPFSSSATLAVPPEPTGAVPEPASWAMMLGGFGIMGYGLRSQRRRKVTFTAA